MKPLLFALDAGDVLADSLASALDLELGALEQRRFPDGESYVRLMTAAEGRDVLFLCVLDHPDAKTLPLLFAADAARRQGARRVGLVAPYLPYLRQDGSFLPGEAVTSVSFAALLSKAFDWLVTVDPHLHRYPDLRSVYSIPTACATAAGPIADWIGGNIERPFLIGPDEESCQWVERIALLAGVEWTVLRKTRKGDLSVKIDGPSLRSFQGTPVIVDDIASSARTMIETVRMLREGGTSAPVCIVVHPLFAGDAWQELSKAGPATIVSTNTIAHESNAIDVASSLATAIEGLFVGMANP